MMRSLLKREWIPTLAILLGGVLLQSMNVLMLTTVLPSIVGELGGVAMLSWPTTAYLASSIVAASCVGVLSTALGARQVYCVGVAIFGVGAVLCSLAPAMGWIVAGRLIQGFGGGLEAAVAYVLAKRGTFPERMWSRTIALMSTSWSMSVLIGPLVGGMFAHFASWRGAFVASAATAVVLAIAAFFVLSPVTAAQRASSARVPLGRVALICLVVGTVTRKTDGFQQGLPYTEITLEVGQSVKSNHGPSYTFRQFGLIEPRSMGNGKVNLMVTPEGWPTYTEGEHVMLFLHAPASETGFQTTAGLVQSKFAIRGDRIANGTGNDALFDGVQINRKLKPELHALDNQPAGSYPAEDFLSLVRTAVEEN